MNKGYCKEKDINWTDFGQTRTRETVTCWNNVGCFVVMLCEAETKHKLPVVNGNWDIRVGVVFKYEKRQQNQQNPC
jgi:hypothetical protein